MPRRIDTAGQNVHNAKAADHAALPNVKNRVRLHFIHKPHVDDISGIQKDDHPGECSPNGFQHVQLCLCEQKRSGLCLIISVLPCCPSNHNDRRSAVLACLLCSLLVKRHLCLRPRVLSPSFPCRKWMFIHVSVIQMQNRTIQPDRRLILKCLTNGYHMGDIHHSA